MNEGPQATAAYLDQDEINLRDLWRVLVKHKKWVLGIPVLSVLIAFISVSLTKPVWEASAAIQGGQVNQVSIEPAARSIERMRLKTFGDAVLTELKISLDEDNPQARLYRNSLKLKVLGGTDLIRLQVRAYSRQEAISGIEATVNQLRKIHQQMAEPSLSLLRQQLTKLKKDIQQVQEERDRLIDNLRLKEGPGYRFADKIALSQLLHSKDAELRRFEDRRFALEEQLGPGRTYATSLLDRVYAGEKPVSPQKLLVLVLSAVAGLLIGILIAFLLNYIKSATPIAEASTVVK